MNRFLPAVAAAILLAPLTPLSPRASAQPTNPSALDQIPCIIVTGHGETTARPDRATVTVGATAQSKDAATAQNQVNQTVGNAIQQIHALGIPEEAIQSQGIDLSPVYSNPSPFHPGENQEQKITGYRATSTVRIRVDDLTKVGPVIDAAVAAGANQIQGVSFELKNDLAQRQTALREASQQARSKAQAIAEAMGVTLGPILEISEQGSQHFPMMSMGARFAADMAPSATPIQAGELTVSEDVTARFRIIQNGH